MAEYVLTSRQSDGRLVTERIEAESGDRAVESLRQRGATQVVLHTDDVVAAVLRPSRDKETVSPGEWLRIRDAGQIGFLFIVVRRLYQVSWKVSVGVLAAVVARRWLACSWGIGDWMLTAWFAVPLLVAVLIMLRGASSSYRRLTEAASWGRWDEVLKRLATLRDRLPPHEFAVREAQALAGLGRLQEGLQILTPFADGSQVPQWMYWSRLAEVYGAARDHESALDSAERAATLAPENAAVLLGLANRLLIHHRDTHRARLLIERARSHKLSDITIPLATVIEGVVAHEEGREQEAIRRLEDALSGLKRFPGVMALAGAVSTQIWTYLALAYASSGDKVTALRCFRTAEPRLRALRHDELLSRCQEALGLRAEEEPEETGE